MSEANIPAIKEELRALALDSASRSKISLLRDVLDDVETALAAGVTQQAVCRLLANKGLRISQRSFATMLSRLRKRRQAARDLSETALTAPPRPSTTVPAATTSSTPPASIGAPSSPPSVTGGSAATKEPPLAAPTRTLEEILQAGPPDVFALEQAYARRRRKAKLAEAKTDKPA